MNQTVNYNEKQLCFLFLQYHSHHTQKPVQYQLKNTPGHFGKLVQIFTHTDQSL